MRNLKRALSLGLTAAMISGLMVMGSSAASYADVADTDNVEAIEVLEAVGIMIGDENGDFNPDQNVTRNEMAVVMSNLMEYNVASYANTSPFTDVPSWAEPYVAACWTNGITAGTSATTYGGSDNVTTSQAALMLMKALGYFQYSQDFGNDWQLATATKGNDIDLFDGVDSGLRDAMTRNDLAQLVLNTLESGTVQASTSGSITVGGVTIATDVQYNYVTSNAGYARSISAEKSTTNTTDAQSAIVELGEDLYQGDLARDWDANDAFGRPASIWSYKDNEIGTYVDDRTATWTSKVTERDLYRSAGTTAVDNYAWNIWQDGVLIEKTKYPDGYELDRNDTDRWKTTGNGVLTEMFVDTVSETVDVTIIHSYVAEVTRVEADEEEGDYNITVSMKTRPAGTAVNREFNSDVEYARGDIVIVGVGDGAIEAMSLAETVEGTVSAVKDNDYLKIDGNPYNYNYAYTANNVIQGYSADNKGLWDLENGEPANPGAGDDVVLYLDANGCVVAIAEAGEIAEDYVYVKGIHQAYGDNSAKIVKYDGTEETIDIDEVDENADPAIARDDEDNIIAYSNGEELGMGVYKYSRSGSAYDLLSSFYVNEDGENEFGATAMVDVKIENGRARMTEEAARADDTYYVDTNTVFVDAYNNTTYIGYNNVPTMSGVKGWVVYDGDSNVADVVFITNNVDYELDNDNFFLVTSNGAEEEYNEDGNVWNYTGYVNGEETTLTFADDKNLTVGVYKITKYDSDGNVTDVEKVVTTDEILDNYGVNSDAYATGQSLTVTDESDKSMDDGESAKNRFTYLDEESLVVVAYLNDDNDAVDSVDVGNLSDINVAKDDIRDEDTSTVYVLNVDDHDEAAPVAKLILVINPDPNGPDASDDTPKPTEGNITLGDVAYTDDITADYTISKTGNMNIEFNIDVPAWVPDGAEVTVDGEVLVDDVYDHDMNPAATGTVKDGKATVRYSESGNYEAEWVVGLDNVTVSYDKTGVRYVDENGNDLTDRLVADSYTEELSTKTAADISFQIDTSSNAATLKYSLAGTDATMTDETSSANDNATQKIGAGGNFSEIAADVKSLGTGWVTVTISGLGAINEEYDITSENDDLTNGTGVAVTEYGVADTANSADKGQMLKIAAATGNSLTGNKAGTTVELTAQLDDGTLGTDTYGLKVTVTINGEDYTVMLTGATAKSLGMVPVNSDIEIKDADVDVEVIADVAVAEDENGAPTVKHTGVGVYEITFNTEIESVNADGKVIAETDVKGVSGNKVLSAEISGNTLTITMQKDLADSDAITLVASKFASVEEPSNTNAADTLTITISGDDETWA